MVAPVDGAELEFDEWMVPWMECYHTDLGAVVTSGAALAARWDKEKRIWAFFIEREIHNLTKEEEKKFHKEVVAAKEKELEAWVELEAIEPILRSEGRNVMTGRWVLRWKLVDGCMVIKARLVIRGFMDRQQGGLDTASFTARRTSQRMVLSVAVQYGWRLFSWDIANAFLRGLSFEELAAQQGGNASEILR